MVCPKMTEPAQPEVTATIENATSRRLRIPTDSLQGHACPAADLATNPMLLPRRHVDPRTAAHELSQPTSPQAGRRTAGQHWPSKFVHPGTIGTSRRSKSHVQAIPGIDVGNRECQVDQLLFVEVLAGLLVDFIWYVALGNLCHRLGPGERRALALIEERGFAPGRQRVQTLFGLTLRACVLRMHVEA